MNFTVNSTRGGLRFGSLSFSDTPGQVFKTPLLVQYTRNGCLPHLTWDVVSKQPELTSVPLLVPIPSSWQKLKETLNILDQDFRKFCRINEKTCPIILSVYDPLMKIKTGFNNKAGISIWSTAGRNYINNDSYTDLVKSMQPSAFQCLCDSDTPRDSNSNKRISNSVKRTLEYLSSTKHKRHIDEHLASFPLLGSIEGGHDLKVRHISVEETTKTENKVDGFVIEGFHSQGHPSDLDLKETKGILESTLALLPTNTPRMMFGSFSPDTMMSLFNLGIDVLDSSFATGLTDEGKAILVSYNDCNGTEFKEGLPPLYVTSSLLDLNLDCFKEDMSPLSSDCRCYSCQKGFSRSYVHHLINTKEMLASVLLNLHNLYVIQDFVSRLQREENNGA